MDKKKSGHAPKLPTDRSFGLTFATVFALLGAWWTWRGNVLGLPSFGVAAAFALVAVVAPRSLRVLNAVWMRFGALLNKVVSPVILGLIFFGVFAPVALFFRLTGRDALRRKFDPDVASYWVPRLPPGPEGKSLPRQF